LQYVSSADRECVVLFSSGVGECPVRLDKTQAKSTTTLAEEVKFVDDLEYIRN